MKMGKTKDFSCYDLANDILRKAGHEKPEEVEPMVRFEEVMKHLLKAEGPKNAKP